VATSLQQLLDDLKARTGAPPPTATIEDLTGALAHLGRALTGLTDDGLTATASPRQRTATELAESCTATGRLWPRTGGPLTDLAGAAADLIGRDRAAMGRRHRWTVTVELAVVADHCARLGRRLLPPEAAPELAFVRQSAADVERDAQADPPTADGYAVLDRLVPLPTPPPGGTRVTALDAAAALLAALDQAQRSDDLPLRDFRAAVAAAEIISRTAVGAAAEAGKDAGPLVVTGLAWQLAGHASMVFHDGRRGERGDRRGVVGWSQTLVGALRNEVDAHAGTAGRREGSGPADVPAAVQQVIGHLPALGDQLAAAVDRWGHTGQFYVNARDLPPVEDMPEDRVSAVIAGQIVPARGADLDRLRQVVDRAADLSTGLADVVHRAAGPPVQGYEVYRRLREARMPRVAELLFDRARGMDRAISPIRSSHLASRDVPPSR
jgi:hypothetical protein